MTSLKRLIESLELYVAKGVPLGSFLEACVENDLRNAFGRADEESREHLFEIVKWLHNEAPSTCWGSREKRIAWQEVRAEERLILDGEPDVDS